MIQTKVMRIRDIREGIGMIQRDLAIKMGVDCSSVTKWGNRGGPAKARDLPRLAHTLGCTIDELFAQDAAC